MWKYWEFHFGNMSVAMFIRPQVEMLVELVGYTAWSSEERPRMVIEICELSHIGDMAHQCTQSSRVKLWRNSH